MPKMHRKHPPHIPGRLGRIQRQQFQGSAPTPIVATSVPNLPRAYPMLDQVSDPAAMRTTRLLWDRVHDLEGRLQAQEGTVPKLIEAANAHASTLSTLSNQMRDALAGAQSAAASDAAATTAIGTGPGTGGSGPGGVTSGPGSEADPLVPMSSDPTTAEDQVKRSLAYWGRTDYSYWGPLVHIPSMTPWGPNTDGNWYVGWDAYMEARASPSDPVSASPSLLPLPAVHQDPVPAGYPTGGWT